MKKKLIAIVFAATFPLVGCTGLQKGALVGGAVGAGLGGVIGHQSEHTDEGALIGAGVGAGLGAIIGNEMDKDKYCPKDGKKYSEDLDYCPEHGVELKYKE